MPVSNPREYMREYRAARRQPLEARPCASCSEPFTPRRSDARYCCDACRAAARRVRVDVTWKRLVGGKFNSRICAGCGAPATRVEYRHHVGTGQVEKIDWCEDHAAERRG